LVELICPFTSFKAKHYPIYAYSCTPPNLRMALLMLRLLLFSLVRLSRCLEVEFFYSPVVDSCTFSQTTAQADGNTIHGGICAYIPDTQRMYACSAPDTQCWSWHQACVGANQTTCVGSGGTQWCCDYYEHCSTTADTICESPFSSPNSGVNISIANSRELIALNVTNITSTIQTGKMAM
jgi:hypothetical protein